MLETIESKIINDYLKTFGTNLFGQPLFRLVWTEDLTELRTGEYNEYYGSLFVRRTSGTLLVPKYNYLRERWIIEEWIDGRKAYHPDLPKSGSGDYNIIYVFGDSNRALPLNKRVVEIVMQAKMNLNRSKLRRQTDAQQRLEDKEKEIEKADWDLINSDSALITTLHSKESILNVGFPKEEKE